MITKIIKLICYFMSPQFFTNLTFIISMILIYFKKKEALPFIIPLNLFILLIGSFISIFFVRSVMKVAVSKLYMPELQIQRFTVLHFTFIILGIAIHVFMTWFLKWYIYNQYTSQEIQYAEDYGDKNRMCIAYYCICIVILYFLTGLYTIYGLNKYVIFGLFIISPFVMYLCTYLDDYFYRPNRRNLYVS